MFIKMKKREEVGWSIKQIVEYRNFPGVRPSDLCTDLGALMERVKEYAEFLKGVERRDSYDKVRAKILSSAADVFLDNIKICH